MKKIITGGIFFASGALFSACADDSSKPNIVVLIADDISMNDFGCYGHPDIKTPNIDNLAKSGLRFTNVFLTASSSSPSRASIITGRYPHNTGACELHTAMGDEQVFIPGALQQEGYYTAQAGKWHFSGGGDDFSGPVSNVFNRKGGDVKHGGGVSGSEMWVTYLKERPKDKPFFMWFAAHDAHRNWDDEVFLEKYKAEDVTVSEFYVDNIASREDIAAYYNEVSRFDYYVGEVVKELKRQRVFDNTFIVVMADNGRPFPRAKTRLIAEGIKTPFIISYPQRIENEGDVCNSLVSIIDLAPTLVELSGGNTQPTFQGKSFVSLLKTPSKKFRDYVFAEHNWHDFEAYERMVCNGEYLLIENQRPNLTAEGAIDVMGGGVGKSLKEAHNKNQLNNLQNDIFITPRADVELYNYIEDKEQINNISSSNPKTRQQLLDVLHQWQVETSDSAPDEITHDWYNRTDLQPSPNHGIRLEMPGVSNGAIRTNRSGHF
ncbi:MAG: sulfatase [Mediterranea sp.]|jgi:arylsulfatase A-like enzyme|nr:sulfatase [Mediterranea sp.]